MRVWTGLWLLLGVWVLVTANAWAGLPEEQGRGLTVAAETKKKPVKAPAKKKATVPAAKPAPVPAEGKDKGAPAAAAAPKAAQQPKPEKASAKNTKEQKSKSDTAKPPWFYLSLRGSMLPVGRYWGVGGKGKGAAMAQSRLLVSGGTGLTFEFAPGDHSSFGFSFDYFYLRNKFKMNQAMIASGISSRQKNHLLDFDFASRSFWRIKQITELYFRSNFGFSLGLYPKSTHWYGLNLQLMPGVLFHFNHVGFFFELGAHTHTLIFKKSSNYGASMGVALLMNLGPVFAF